MAVPKRKTSRSNTRSRRSQWKTSAPTLVALPEPRVRPDEAAAHGVRNCGQYDGKQVLEV